MIRPFHKSDFTLLQSWWGDNASCPKTLEDIPPGTYILEHEGKPAASMAILTTDWSKACWFEQLIADPSLPRETRRAVVGQLFHLLEIKARDLGYANVILFSYVDPLKARYQELGFMPTLTNVTTFSKPL